MKRNRKLLLITAGTMNYTTGGSVMYRNILQHIPPEQLYWAVAGGWSKRIPPWMEKYERCVCSSLLLHRYVFGLVRRILFHHLLLHRIWFWYAYRWFPMRAAKKISKFAQQQQVTKIWVHATGPAIGVAVRLQKMLGLPIHVDVQDDIDGHIGPKEGNWLREDFLELLQNATTCNVTTSSMKEYYIQKYNACKDALVFWNGGIFGSIPPSPQLRKSIRIIGLAGNIWCPDAVNILLSTLNLLNAERDTKNIVKLRVYSTRIKIKHPYLEFKGLVGPTQIVSVLQECDLLYVPMSFLSRYKVLCRTSLPGKILTYIQAQIPIVAHGPEYASNVKFTREHSIGLASTTMSPAILAKDIEQYEHDYNSRIEASRRSRELCQTKFSPEQIWQWFQKVLFKEK